MTDDLIGRLAADVTAVPSGVVQRRIALAVVVGLAGSGALLAWIGLRGDFPAAFGSMVFWTKLVYPLLLAGCGVFAVERLSRPGARGRAGFVAVFAFFALVAAAGAIQLMVAAPSDMRGLVMGSTALVCPLLIVTTGAPVLVATLFAMSTLAPVNLTLAGTAAGLLAGGVGAAVYSFHCGEHGLPFLALWYTLGVVLTAALGAILGRWALRW